MKNRPSGLVYRKAGRKAKLMEGRPGRPSVGTILGNAYGGRSASRPTLCIVERRGGEVVALPSERVKVIL
jgi:hypothetical protein